MWIWNNSNMNSSSLVVASFPGLQTPSTSSRFWSHTASNQKLEAGKAWKWGGSLASIPSLTLVFDRLCRNYVETSLVPRLSPRMNEKPLFHPASDRKLGGAWERGYVETEGGWKSRNDYIRRKVSCTNVHAAEHIIDHLDDSLLEGWERSFCFQCSKGLIKHVCSTL